MMDCSDCNIVEVSGIMELFEFLGYALVLAAAIIAVILIVEKIKGRQF